MSNQADSLSRSLRDLEQMVPMIAVGTADRVRYMRKIDLALQRALSWAHSDLPLTGIRGGSSDPMSKAERDEESRLKQLAAEFAREAPDLIRDIEKKTEALYRKFVKLIAVIDQSKLPSEEDTIPGCKSCARTEGSDERKIGGHFTGVYDKAKSSGLCRWCLDVRTATGSLPPVRAVEIYHRQSPRAAGLWMARMVEKPSKVSA